MTNTIQSTENKGTHLLNKSFDDYCEKQDKSSTFLIDLQGNTHTYASFLSASKKFARLLETKGIGKGTHVAVSLPNSIELAHLYFAAMYVGCVCIPIHPSWSNDTVSYIFENVDVQFLITSEAVSKDNSVFGSIDSQILYFESQKNENSSEHTFTFEDVNACEETTSAIDVKQEALIIFTSGTTSNPKGVIHSLEDLFANGSLFVEAMGIKPSARFYNNLSMCYLGGYYNLLVLPFLAGSSVVVDKPFNIVSMRTFWKPIIEHSINTLWFVPTMLQGIMRFDAGEKGTGYTQDNDVQCFVGTAVLSPNLKQQFEAKYSVSLRENYGLSETLFISTQSTSTHKSVGALLPHIDTKIVDPKTNQLAPEGEILVKTPYLFKGYLQDGKRIEAVDETGWFRTGDIGRFDEKNDLIITDRLKDIIIKGGLNISPSAIEDVVKQVSEVEECAVIGIQSDIYGEEIVAVYKSADSSPGLEDKILATCREHLAAPQVPNRVIQLSEFPYTSSGKIQKRKVRNWIQSHADLDKNIKKTEAENMDSTTFYKPSKVMQEANDALSIRYNTMVYELKQKGVEVTVLSLGEAFFDIPMFDFQALDYPSLYHYSHSRGLIELRTMLADFFEREYAVKFDPESEILVTAGSKAVIYMIFLAFLNQGDEVLIPDPSWVSYPEQVKLTGGVPVGIPYDKTVFEYEEFITNRTKMIVINNPNNPRGNVLTLDELAHLYKLAKKYNLFILADEAYSEFVGNSDEFISLGNLDKNMERSIVVNSISKNFGISGWRIGYAISNQSVIDKLLMLNQHIVTCAPTILQQYVVKYFDKVLDYTGPQMKALIEKRSELKSYMDSIGLTYLPGNATFYFFVSIEGSSLTSDEFCTRLLQEKSICAVPGIGYGESCDRFIRVSVGTETMEKTKWALDTIQQFIQDT